MKKSKLIRMQDVVMGGITVSSLFLLLNVSGVYATGVTDEVIVTIPESCSLTSTVTTAHTAIVENGVYNDNIGETSISAFCNDSEGFSVYAVGYTNDEYGNNTMRPSTIVASNAIATGLATSGTTSNWAMKLTSASENFALTNDFGSFHVIPDSYTKVATYPSNTTSVSGVQVKSTYAVYASGTQPADSYAGKVKYTILHPSSAVPPIESIKDLTYMQDFNGLSDAEREAVFDSMQDRTTYILIDNRDNKTYKIAKLKDGNVWMTESLDLGRTNLTTDLTSANTNLSTTVTASTFNSWKKTSGTSTYNSGEFISLTTSNSYNGRDSDPTSGTSYGTLYNYYVVSGGTISGMSYTNDTPNDICPAGWRLPTGAEATGGEFQVLYNLYNSNALMRAPIADGGAAFGLSGSVVYGSPVSQGSSGSYWSSTGQGANVFGLSVYQSGGVSTGVTFPRSEAKAIRCIVKFEKTISNTTYLQDYYYYSPGQKASVLNSMEENTTYNLIDNRDNKSYAVAKLKDGNIWMVENLDLGRTDLTVDLNRRNTHFAIGLTEQAATVSAATFNSWRKSSGTATLTAGEFVNLSGTDSTSGMPRGTLYNYHAASAGTVTGDTNSNDATSDICPAGWRLPTAGASSEFQTLYSHYNSIALMRAPIANGGAAFTFTGFFMNSTPTESGSNGYFWGSNRKTSSNMYCMRINSYYVLPENDFGRYDGISIRCIGN